MKHLLSLLPDKFYLVLLLILLALVSATVYQLNFGLDNSIDWIVTTNTEIQKLNVDTFSNGLFVFNIPGDNHLIWKTFSVTSMYQNFSYLHLMLVALMIGLSLVHTAVSYFSRIPFLGANLLLIFLINMMHLEQSLPFGSSERIPVFVIIGLLLAVGFLFNSIIETVPTYLRFVAFLVIYSIAAVVISTTTSLEFPFLSIAPYAFNAAVIFTILFIAFVSQEVIYLILRIASRSGGAGSGNLKNGRHFLIVSSLYLINLLLLYLRNASHIKVELSFINEFTILIFSTIITVYTLKEKKVLFNEEFEKWGYYLFAGLGIIAFGLITSQGAFTNSPVLDAIEDAVSYIHLAFGVMFFFYIILNFLTPLFKNFQVYKIVYKEVNFPYITSLLASIVGVAGFYFYTSQGIYYEAKSGYLNLHGDIELFKGNVGLAQRYYEQSEVYGGSNHKSSYQLATISARNGQKSDFEYYMKRAFLRNASEQSYIRLAEFYKDESDYFKSLFVLRDGLKKFPKSTYLRNNIAVMYSNLNILDSALIYLDKSIFESDWKGMSESNSWYVYSKSNLNFNRDSLEQLFMETDDASVQSNYLGYANGRNMKLNVPQYNLFTDSILDNSKLAILNNLSSNNTGVDFDLTDEIINRTNVFQNSSYSTILDYSAVISSYFRYDYNTALRTLDKLQGATPSQKGHYLNLAGLMAYKESAYETSLDFLSRSLEAGNLEAALNYGLVLSETGRIDEAIQYWSQVESTTTDSSLYDLAYNLKRNLSLSSQEAIANTNDVVKFQYLKFNGSNLGFQEFVEVANSITEFNLKSGVVNDQILDLLNKGKLEEANEYVEFASANQLTVSPMLIRDFVLLSHLGSTVEIEGKNTLLNLLDEDLDSLTLSKISQIAITNPFDEALIVYSCSILKSKGHLQTAYDILQSATEVNTYSIPLLKEFTLTAVEANFSNYGETALLRLYELLDPKDYSAFSREFDSLKEEVENRDVWGI